MTTEKIYGPGIKWDGGECPVPLDTKVEVTLRSGKVLEPALAFCYGWNHFYQRGDIVEYRTVTEPPDLDAAEKLLRDNGYTVTPPAKPLTFEDVTPMTEAPQKGTEYWVIHPLKCRGAEAIAWDGDAYDLAALRHRMAYLEKEHALIAARHLFGLKGGEL